MVFFRGWITYNYYRPVPSLPAPSSPVAAALVRRVEVTGLPRRSHQFEWSKPPVWLIKVCSLTTQSMQFDSSKSPVWLIKVDSLSGRVWWCFLWGRGMHRMGYMAHSMAHQSGMGWAYAIYLLRCYDMHEWCSCKYEWNWLKKSIDGAMPGCLTGWSFKLTTK